MRLIDAEPLEKKMRLAIALMKRALQELGEDEGLQMELKAYRDVLEGIEAEPTVKE